MDKFLDKKNTTVCTRLVLFREPKSCVFSNSTRTENLGTFPKQLGTMSEEQEERPHQDISRGWNENIKKIEGLTTMMVDYCWILQGAFQMLFISEDEIISE